MNKFYGVLILLITQGTAYSAPKTTIIPIITCIPLTKGEISTHFGSNNPIKKFLFKHSYQAYALTIANPTTSNFILQSSQCLPTPLPPIQVEQKLSQSMALAPWLIGIGWTTALTAGIGIAIIPSVLFGATLIIAGVIGMNNNPLPSSTAHTIKHLLVDGTHDYLIPAVSKTKLIIILPTATPTLSVTIQPQDSLQTMRHLMNLKEG